jgi:Flp pilus assembly protein TadD
VRNVWLAPIAAAVLLLALYQACNAIAGGAEEQVCDVDADYALGIEDYAEAVRLHLQVVSNHPENALAHYHLGFAESMVGDKTAEIREYQRAQALGLRNWDLFLNLGLAQLEKDDLDGAARSLRQAVLLGGQHPESHFNLAIVDERRGMLADAERETLASLQLEPAQPDARNLLGVIDAQQGKIVDASLIWRELVREMPEYEPARTNLAILRSRSQTARAETMTIAPSPATALKARGGQGELHSPALEIHLGAGPAR